MFCLDMGKLRGNRRNSEPSFLIFLQNERVGNLENWEKFFYDHTVPEIARCSILDPACTLV